MPPLTPPLPTTDPLTAPPSDEAAYLDWLLDGLQWHFYGHEHSPINHFYTLDHVDIDNPDFWATAEHLFSRLAAHARAQRLACHPSKRLAHDLH